MNEQIISSFIFYLAIFRLAMISAGIICIVLGYKLFIKGVNPASGNKAGTDLGGDIGKFKFQLKNAAPGTVFGLLGVIIIAAMYISGPPELTLENISNPETLTSQNVKLNKIKMRSTDSDSLQSAINRAIQAQQAADTITAIREYKNAIKPAGFALNQAAWLLLAKGKQEDAYSLARTAVIVCPNDADILDTCAEILFKRGDYQLALDHAEKAAKLNPEYAAKIKKYKDAYDLFRAK